MIIKSEYGVSYSSDKESLVLEDVFWLYNPTTHTGLAAFKFDGVIYVAEKTRSEWSANYNMDTANPVILKPEQVDKFIALAIKDGMQVVFNVMTEEYNGIQKYSEKEVTDLISLTLSGCDFTDRRISNFKYRNVNDLVVTDKTKGSEEGFRRFLALEDLRVPYKAHETLTKEQIIHRYQKMTEDFRKTQPTGKITIPDFHMHFQNVRQVMHFAANSGNLNLLKDIHQNYELQSVEPTPEWILNNVMQDDKEEIQRYFIDHISYNEMPWHEDNNIMKTHGTHVQKVMGDKVHSLLGRKLYERYYVENFRWGAK